MTCNIFATKRKEEKKLIIIDSTIQLIITNLHFCNPMICNAWIAYLESQ